MIKKTFKIVLFIILPVLLGSIIYSFFVNPSVDKKRVDIALKYCKSHNMNTNIILLNDFSKHSGTRRFVVYDTKRKRVILSSLCDQGKGEGFSNKPGSYCSSLGFFKVCGQHKMRIGINSFILQGLSPSNSNAQSRGILIHPYYNVSDVVTYPVPIIRHASKGCFILSPLKYKILRRIIKKNSDKPILLYAYH